MAELLAVTATAPQPEIVVPLRLKLTVPAVPDGPVAAVRVIAVFGGRGRAGRRGQRHGARHRGWSPLTVLPVDALRASPSGCSSR